MDQYHVLECIGEGSFGRVYRGRKRFTGKVICANTGIAYIHILHIDGGSQIHTKIWKKRSSFPKPKERDRNNEIDGPSKYNLHGRRF